jgi:hypothetical protein
MTPPAPAPRDESQHPVADSSDHPARRDLDIDVYIRDLVAAAPPLTPAQRDRLALLFSGTRHARQGNRDGSRTG